MGNVYYTGSLTPNSGSAVDPNEIPAGTVYEGKFSELPQFFASLEGKYCPTPVIYKITEDEAIEGALGNLIINNSNIPEVIIDVNEKTITYTSTGNYQRFIILQSINSTISLINGTFTLSNPSANPATLITFSGAVPLSNTQGIVSNCTFNNASDGAITAMRGAKVLIQNVEIKSVSRIGSGVVAYDAGYVVVMNSIMHNIVNACFALDGGFLQACNLTLSSITTNYSTNTGGQILHD